MKSKEKLYFKILQDVSARIRKAVNDYENDKDAERMKTELISILEGRGIQMKKPKSGLKPGDQVIMHSCYESKKAKYKDKVWTVESEPWDLCGSEVVRLEGFSGGFATEYLKKV